MPITYLDKSQALGKPTPSYTLPQEPPSDRTRRDHAYNPATPSRIRKARSAQYRRPASAGGRIGCSPDGRRKGCRCKRGRRMIDTWNGRQVPACTKRIRRHLRLPVCAIHFCRIQECRHAIPEKVAHESCLASHNMAHFRHHACHVAWSIFIFAYLSGNFSPHRILFICTLPFANMDF